MNEKGVSRIEKSHKTYILKMSVSFEIEEKRDEVFRVEQIVWTNTIVLHNYKWFAYSDTDKQIYKHSIQRHYL